MKPTKHTIKEAKTQTTIKIQTIRTRTRTRTIKIQTIKVQRVKRNIHIYYTGKI